MTGVLAGPTDWILDGATNWILDRIRDAFNQVWALLSATLFHLPDVSDLPQVMAVNTRALFVVNTCYVLAVIAAALAVMTHGSIQIRTGASDVLPRLVIGLVAANFAAPVNHHIIESANALVLGLTGQGIASDVTFKQLLPMITAPLLNPVLAVLVVVIALIVLVLVVLLIVGWITRFFILVVLCAVAPLALACHGTPWTDPIARLWWRSMGGVVAVVVLQALVVNTSLSLLFDPGTNLGSYGLPTADADKDWLNLLIIACLLWVTVQIPGLIRRHVTEGGGRQNVFRALVRLVIAQQVTRGLGNALRASARSPRGVHRGAGGRHATGRTTGDPLRGFTAPARREHAGAHRGDRARHATQRAGDDPLHDVLTPPASGRRVTGQPPRTRRSPRPNGPGTPAPRPAPAMRTDPPRTPPRRTPPPNRSSS